MYIKESQHTPHFPLSGAIMPMFCGIFANRVRTYIELNVSPPLPSFVLISDPECQCEGPGPAAEPAAASYGEQRVGAGKGGEKETFGIKRRAEEVE